MSHLLFEGTVHHKRFLPKVHEFTYPFFLLDIDLTNIQTLTNNFFSFKAKDHFGNTTNFEKNVNDLIDKFSIDTPHSMRFLTLPRIFNFVFNPISVLVLFDEEKLPKYMLAEVHNYNGGRIVYPVKLEQKSQNIFCGSVHKDMYVSPFLHRDGRYKFTLDYTQEHLNMTITLYEENTKTLIASLQTSSMQYSDKNIRKIFMRHMFLTFAVVTRTLWQSLKLYLKGIKFYKVTPQDQIRRY